MAEAKPGTSKTVTSADYIRANFQPSDRIAVLLRNAATSRDRTAHKHRGENCGKSIPRLDALQERKRGLRHIRGDECTEAHSFYAHQG